MNKLELRERILTCTSCSLNERCAAPVAWSGPVPAKVAVLGEAPGKQEDDQGAPFVGPSGTLLKESLKSAGFNIPELAFINTASCFPNDEGRGRAPTPTEVRSCAQNREDQLALVGAEFVLLTGNVPLQAYRPDLRISKARAHPMKRGGRVLFPVFHPAAILRNAGWRADFEADIRLFLKLTNHDSKAWWPITPTCVVCGKPEEKIEYWRMDRDGIPYCNKCWVLSPEGRL